MFAFARVPSGLLNRPQCLPLRHLTASPLRSRPAGSVCNALTKPRLGLRTASNATHAPTVYPSRLLIFHSPTLETTFIGTTKLTLLGGFVMSCLVVAPNVYLDEAAPIWMPPAVIATAAFFMTGCHLLTRPYITNIFIQPPGWARRSREALLNFARRLPSDTVLEIETLGFLPVPRRKAVRVCDLRTVPQGLGLANLERATANEGTSKLPKSMRWSLNQFYARPSAGHWQKSRAPDVWPLVWDFVSKNSVRGMSKNNVSSTVAKPVAGLNDGVQKRMLPVASAVTKSQQKSRKR